MSLKDDDRPDEPLPGMESKTVDFSLNGRFYIMIDGSAWEDEQYLSARNRDTWTREEMR